MIVIKRDGSQEDFSLKKIEMAVRKSFESTGRKAPKYLSNMVKAYFGK